MTMLAPHDLCRVLELLRDLRKALQARNDVEMPGYFLGSPPDVVATYHALTWNGQPVGGGTFLAFAPYAWAQSGGVTPLWVWVVNGGPVQNAHLGDLLNQFEGVVIQHRNGNQFSLFIPICIPPSFPVNKQVVDNAVVQVVNILEQLRNLAGGGQA